LDWFDAFFRFDGKGEAMATLKSFEELDCWQGKRELVKTIYSITHNQQFKRDIDLARQIRRSAVSSMANIAEGFHRNSPKDFMRFLNYSRSSIAETISHAYVAMDQQYITIGDVDQIKETSETIWKKINALITYLNQFDKTGSIKHVDH
jgi:four helix bundle protein